MGDKGPEIKERHPAAIAVERAVAAGKPCGW